MGTTEGSSSGVERPDETNPWQQADDYRCPETLGRGRCALNAGHDGLHSPLSVLWQQAGYEDGEWTQDAMLASLQRVEAERDRLAEAKVHLLEIAEHLEPYWDNGSIGAQKMRERIEFLATLDREPGE